MTVVQITLFFVRFASRKAQTIKRQDHRTLPAASSSTPKKTMHLKSTSRDTCRLTRLFRCDIQRPRRWADWRSQIVLQEFYKTTFLFLFLSKIVSSNNLVNNSLINRKRCQIFSSTRKFPQPKGTLYVSKLEDE